LGVFFKKYTQFFLLSQYFFVLLRNHSTKENSMNIKESLGKVFDRFVVINLSAMLVIIILLCIGVGVGLDLYTHHAENVKVPNLKGMDYYKARRQLESLGLVIVVSDSGYNKAQPANSILLHTPGEGQNVKAGRVIYVTINSPSSPTFALPDLVDNSSMREAEARLTAMGFRLTPPLMVDGEKDWVYGILCRGRRVSNGDRVAIDHPLTLMVGRGTIEDLDDIDMVGAEEVEDDSETDDFEEVSIQ
jgi:beta-lactam-binding protein with PASTA domain